MPEIFYYELVDGTICSTNGLDPFMANNDSTVNRVFRMDGPVLKCIHDNLRMPWGYHLSVEETMQIVLKSSDPTDTDHLLPE